MGRRAQLGAGAAGAVESDQILSVWAKYVGWTHGRWRWRRFGLRFWLMVSDWSRWGRWWWRRRRRRGRLRFRFWLWNGNGNGDRTTGARHGRRRRL